MLYYLSMYFHYQCAYSRILVRNVSKFSDDKDWVTWYIPSAYIDQMSTQFIAVSVCNKYGG